MKPRPTDRQPPDALPDVALADLDSLDRAGLLALWQEAFETPAPAGISQPLLRRILAWEIQARRLGGLTAKERVGIDRLAGEGRRPGAPRMATGTRYLREWNGVTHVVERVAEGYLWNGAVHRSLTAIAAVITGAHWSGPRFFGVTGNARGAPRRKGGGPR